MCNTYGIRSVNLDTFNQRNGSGPRYPRDARNDVVTILRIHNGALNVLGYIPGVSTLSGCVRIATGLTIIGGTKAIGDRNASNGAIIGRWYDEAIYTGGAQIVRGALEASGPVGSLANMCLDMGATLLNVYSEISARVCLCAQCLMVDDRPDPANLHVRPHRDTSYPCPLALLHLV
jgi:hypothetical protein